MRRAFCVSVVLFLVACGTQSESDTVQQADVAMDSAQQADMPTDPDLAVAVETITAEDWTLAAGEEKILTESFVLEASGNVFIAGRLIAPEGSGFRIAITAKGSIIVDGTLEAGSGGPSGDGGAIELVADGGLTIGPASRIAAGDGGDGGSGQAGGDGGDVSLKTADTLVVNVHTGAVVTGNGGRGGDLVVEEATLEAPAEVSPTNRGGDSGQFEFQATKVEGFEVVEKTWDQDETGKDGMVFVAAGTTLRGPKEPSLFLSGGNGGDAGAVSCGSDLDGEWAQPAANWPFPRPLTAADLPELKVKGATGGEGWFQGGKGGDATVSGKPGVAPGGAGQDVEAYGGSGGSCSALGLLTSCTPGNGGNAVASGGVGAKGANPSEPGGHGGNASAWAGSPGYYYISACGSAKATGGKGGTGGDGCATEPHAAKGGQGGMGGWAVATADSYCSEHNGNAAAVGGDGGAGGGGEKEPGSGGLGGNGSANTNATKTQKDGEGGPNGGTCPTVQPKECSCKTPGAKVVAVTCDWPDATACSGWHSACCGEDTPCTFTEDTVVPDGTTCTAWGCTLKLVCP